MVINKLICKGVPSHTCSIKIVITSKSKEGLRSLDKDRLPDERFLDRRRPFFYSFSSIKLEQNKQNRNLYSPSFKCLNSMFLRKPALLRNPSVLLQLSIHSILLHPSLLIRGHLGHLAEDSVVNMDPPTKFLLSTLTIHLSAPKEQFKNNLWLIGTNCILISTQEDIWLVIGGLRLICLIHFGLFEEIHFYWFI